MSLRYSAALTVDHTKVSTNDQTDFQVLVVGSGVTAFKGVANGGYVAESHGYDIVFTSDSGGSTVLDFERVYWKATGDFEFHVRVPTLSHSSDTTIYVWIGDGSHTDASNSAGVWKSGSQNYAGVFHFGDGTTLSLNDSTTYGNNGTAHETPIAGAGAFGGSLGGALDLGSDNPNDTTNRFVRADGVAAVTAMTSGSYSVDAWFYCYNTTPYGASDPNLHNDVIVGMDSFDSTHSGESDGFDLEMLEGTTSSNQCDFSIGKTGSGSAAFAASLHPTMDGAWHHYAGTWDETAQSVKLYLDGALSHTTAAGAASYSPRSSWFTIGEGGNQNRTGPDASGSALHLHDEQARGIIDEVRIIPLVVRTADWYATQYANQSSPSTFYTIGSFTDHGSTTPADPFDARPTAQAIFRAALY